MPLFRRPDGALIRDESPSRLIMPYLMRGRNESVIFHEQLYDVAAAQKWLRAFNKGAGGPSATLFHLFLWACGKAAHQRPHMNRFVSGGRLYQRKGFWISFVAQRTFGRDSPLAPIKLEFADPDAGLAEFVSRVTSEIERARSDAERPVDRETRLSIAAPHFVRRIVAALYRTGDRLNLLPGGLIRNDPLYATFFVANLGSLGLNRTWHHLYEHGSCSLFAALGTPCKTAFIDRTGAQTIRDGMSVRWSFDERITDAHYCAESLALAQRIVESPEEYLGPPDAAIAPKPGE